MMKRKKEDEAGPASGRSPIGGIDFLLAAFAARAHVAKAWEELLAAADAFLVALEPVLERGAEGNNEPAKAALGVVRRLRGQIVRMKGVSFLAAADLVLSLGRSLSGLWKQNTADANPADGGVPPQGEVSANVPRGTNGKATKKTGKRAGHAERVKISGQE